MSTPRPIKNRTMSHNETLQLQTTSTAALTSDLQTLQVRRHRRSISQLMASMGKLLPSLSLSLSHTVRSLCLCCVFQVTFSHVGKNNLSKWNPNQIS